LTDYLTYSAGTNGSQRMRKAFCASVLKAPMSFFMTENLGPIIQVFSRDLSVVSEDLIDSFHYAMLYSFITLALVIRTVQDQPLFCVVGFPLLIVAALILNNYNKKLKLVKTELKTANDELFHAIADSIEGVKVLRTADGTMWAIDLLNEAFRNARIAIVASENCNIWLMRRLDPISTLLAFLTLIMSTQINTKQFPILPPNIQNVYLQQSLAYLVFVHWSLKAMGMFVYNLGMVERIHQYIKDIPQERSGSHELDPSWPKSGEVEFNRVCLKYAPHLPLALNNVTFKLSHGAKVGVVGRTGSGKSTLLVSLFRLMQPCDGDMKVAGTSITDARVNSLRQQLSIVPQVLAATRSYLLSLTPALVQEPVMFSGTLRENVDPLCLYTDHEVRDALQQSGLGSKALGSAVGVSGAGWSLGEKQLVSAAQRALA
jgi:ATP-binding cassette, subfamily C (CFTR/MRP), member 1